MTIVITYADGSVESYSGCTGYTNDGKIVKFKGKLSGDNTSKDWSINWDKVKKLSSEV